MSKELEDQRFRKIKISPKGVELVYETYKNSDVHATVFKSDDEPLESFREALQELKPFIRRILGLPKAYMETIHIRSIGIAYKGAEERMQLTVHGVKDLSDSFRPWNINTPLMAGPDEDEDASDLGPTLNDEEMIAVDNIIREAIQYLMGKRAPKPEQLKLVS